MITSYISSGSPGGGLRQGSIAFKKISELTAGGKNKHDIIHTMRSANLAVVQAKIAAPATRVVSRLKDTRKVAQKRALCIARQ